MISFSDYVKDKKEKKNDENRRTFSDYMTEKDISSGNLSQDISLFNRYLSDLSSNWHDDEYMSSKPYSQRMESITERLAKAKAYGEKNGINDDFMKNIDTLTSYYSDFEKGYDSLSKQYRKYKNADDYNLAIENAKKAEEEYKKSLGLNIESEQNEVDRLKGLLEKATGNNSSTKYLKEAGVSSIKELKSAISEKEIAIKTADRNKTAESFKNIPLQEPNYEQYVSEGRELAINDFVGNERLYSELGKNSAYTDLKNKIMDLSTGGVSSNTDDDRDMIGIIEGWGQKDDKYNYLTDDEVKNYFFYYKIDPSYATKYLDTLEESINYRVSEDVYDHSLLGNTGLELAFAAAQGLQQFEKGLEGVVNSAIGNDNYQPATILQQAGGLARYDLGDKGLNINGTSIGQVGYDLVSTTANMLPSILVSSFASPLAGSALLGASAGGNAYTEMINLGYSKEQARNYELLVGASESSLQYLLGGIGSLGNGGDGLFGGLTEKLLTKVDNAIARTAIKIGGNMLSEGSEEYLQDIIEPWFRNVVFNENNDITLISDDALYSGLLGALSAGFLEAGGTISEEVNNYNVGKVLKSDSAMVERLKNIGSTFSADTVSYKIASKVDENTSAYELGRLLNSVNAELTEQNKADITEKLIQRGVDSKSAMTISDWLGDIVSGVEPTKREIKAIEMNDDIADVFRESVIDENSTVYQRIAGVNDITELASDMARNNKPIRKAYTSFKSYLDAKAEKKADNNRNPAENGTVAFKNENGSVDNTSIKKLASVSDKTVELENGTVANIDDVEFANADDELLYKNITKLGLDDITTQKLIDEYYDSGLKPSDYILGVNELYNYSKSGIVKTRGTFSGKLNAKTSDIVVKAGIESRANQLAKDNANRVFTADGRVTFDDGVEDYIRSHSRAKASAEIVSKIASATNSSVHWYKSRKNSNGTWVYDKDLVDRNGKVIAKAGDNAGNGITVRSTGDIYLDVNAGMNGEGIPLAFLGHEQLHELRVKNPTGYDSVRDTVMNAFAELDGVYAEDAINADLRNHANDDTYTHDVAEEEFVARCLERVYIDTDLADRLIESANGDKTVLQHIADFFKNILNKLKNVYKEIMANSNAVSSEATLLSQNIEGLQKIADAFENALKDMAGMPESNPTEVSKEINELNDSGFDADQKTRTVYLSPKYSYALGWNNKKQKDIIQSIMKFTGRSEEDVKRYLDAEYSASLSVKGTRLDFVPSELETALKANSDYAQGTIDLTNICPKRVPFTNFLNRLHSALPEDMFTADDYADIRLILMNDESIVACGLCFVEDRRQHTGEIADSFIKQWQAAMDNVGKNKKFNKGFLTKLNSKKEESEVSIGKEVAERYGVKPGKVKPFKIEMNQDTFTNSDSWHTFQKEHPDVAAAFEAFNNARGQASARLLLDRAEYKREILGWKKTTVDKVNRLGGLRIFSFSDFEVTHIVDLIQIITDCATKGVKIQGYTKQAAFAKLVENTGLKLNLSFIPYGATGIKIVNGKKVLAYDTVEGINPNDPNFPKKDNDNISHEITGINDEQIGIAMLDDFFHFIIPFHSNKDMRINQKLGVGVWKNYKEYQTDKQANSPKLYQEMLSYIIKNKKDGVSESDAYDNAINEYKGNHKDDGNEITSASNNVNIYTDVIPYLDADANAEQFVNKYLDVCEKMNIIPRFAQFLNIDKIVDESGNVEFKFKYRKGYEKFLVDFRLFGSDGKISLQQNIVPDFDSAYIQSLIDAENAKSDAEYYNANYPEELYENVLNYIKVKHNRKGNKALYEKYQKIVEKQAEAENSDAEERKGRIAYSNSLREVPAVVPSTSNWSRSITTDEALERFPTLWNVKAEKSEKRNPTQVQDTVSTYRKIYNILESEGFYGNILDASSGLGYGTEAGIKEYGFDVEDIEPYPGEEYNPKYTDYSALDKKYDVIISNAVLNVLPQDQRDALVVKMGELLKDGGRIFINVRGNDVFNASSAEIINKAGKEVFISNKGSYQKGFTPNELVAYLSDALGDGFNVVKTNKFGRVSAIVTKNENGYRLSSRDEQYLANSTKKYGDVESAAIEHFGITDNFRLGGYILSDGRMLDFSGVHWLEGSPKSVIDNFKNTNDIRQVDHEDIFEAFDIASGKSAGDNRKEFINRGNVRMSPEAPGINIASEPTAEQYQTIREMIEANPYNASGFYVDIEDKNNRVEKLSYSGDVDADKVINDIKYYYANGKARDNSLNQFRFSERNETKFSTFNGKEFWSGAVNLADGVIEEVHPYEEAENALFHHSLYFSDNAIEKMDNSEWAFFYIEDGNVYDWDIELSDSIVRKIKSQVVTQSNAGLRFSDRVLGFGSLFSGGGLLESGLVSKMLRSNFASELDGKIAAVYANNFGDHVTVGDVRNFDSTGYKDTFYLHASPVCKSFSRANTKGGQNKTDIITAEATARVLSEQMPVVFTVENVQEYIGTDAYNIIINKLKELGYTWDVDVYKASDFGNPTKRKRMILRAIKDGELPSKPAPTVSENVSWYDAVKDLIDSGKGLVKSSLPQYMITALRKDSKLSKLKLSKLEQPLMIYGTSKSKNAIYAWGNELAPTLTTKCGDARIIMPDGKVYSPTPELMGRLQGIPDGYKYPKAKTRAFTIIGNGIPVQLTRNVIGELLDYAYNLENEGSLFSQSERLKQNLTDREILSNALDSAVANDVEKKRLEDYKKNIKKMNEEEDKLKSLNAQIKELSFAEGKRDTAKINELKAEAKATENRINIYDKRLVSFEATKPIKNVLQREKNRIRKKTTANLKEKYTQKLSEQRERSERKANEMKEKYMSREQRLKEKNQQQIDEIKARYNDSFAKYKKNQQEKMDKVVEHYREMREKNVEGRQKTVMRNKIKGILNQLQSLLDSDSKNKHILINMKESVLESLMFVNMENPEIDEHIDLLMKQMETETDREQIEILQNKIDRLLRKKQKVRDRLANLKADYDALRDSYDPLYRNAYAQEISDQLEYLTNEIGDKPFDALSLEELSLLYDSYKAIYNAVKNSNKAFRDSRNRTISELGSMTRDEIKQVGGSHYKVLKSISDFMKIGWSYFKPIYAMRTIGSDTFTDAFKNILKAQGTWYKDMNEGKEFRLDVVNKHGRNSWDFKKKYEFTSSNGKSFELTLGEIMSLYAFSKRNQALEHLSEGGFVFDKNIVVTDTKELGKLNVPVKYTVNTANAFTLNSDALNTVISTLTSEQIAYVDEMQDYLSTVMSAKGNEVSEELYGIDLFKEKVYFPLRSAEQYMYEEGKKANNMSALKESGFTKPTKPHAKNPIIINDFDTVWASHVDKMSMYHAFVLPIEDFNRIYNYGVGSGDTTVKAAIENAYGTGATNYIKNLIQDINGGTFNNGGAEIINKLIGLFKKGAVFASASVTVQQYSAIARAMAYIDPKYFASTIPNAINFKKHNSLWDEIKKYSWIGGIKEMGYFDTGVGQGSVEWLLENQYEGLKEKSKAFFLDSKYRDDILSKAPALVDEVAWVHIWEALKKQTQDENPNSTEEEIKVIAGERFSEIIELTQVYDSVLTRSGMMRSKDTGMKAATAFLAEPTVTMNMMLDAMIQGKRAGIKNGGAEILARVTGACVASIVLNSLLKSIVYAYRDDDDDKKYADRYVASLKDSLLDEINPLNMIPFARDVVSLFQGYNVTRSDMSLFQDLARAINNLDSKKKSNYEKVTGIIGAVAAFFGIPYKNVERDLRPIISLLFKKNKEDDKKQK